MAALHAYATPITGPDVHHLGGRNSKHANDCRSDTHEGERERHIACLNRRQ
jgi:hypothetical protein